MPKFGMLSCLELTGPGTKAQEDHAAQEHEEHNCVRVSVKLEVSKASLGVSARLMEYILAFTGCPSLVGPSDG